MTLPRTCENENKENPTETRCSPEKRYDLLACNFCNKKFTAKKNFVHHLHSHKNYEDLDENEKRKRCIVCLKKFTAKKNLLKHLRVVHKNYSEAESLVVKKIKCPESNCEFMCRMMKALRNHIETCHRIKILKDILQFPTEAAFQKWKKEEESNTVSWFVTGRMKSTLTDGTKKQILYCHRSGQYSPKGFGKYRMRSVGSCKIGVTCPAAMEIMESSEGGLTVIYYKTHLGHLQDVVYLKITSEERDQLAEKIKQGFSFDSILEDIKEREDANSERKKRIHLLSKKDLYSIMQRKKTGNESGKSSETMKSSDGREGSENGKASESTRSNETETTSKSGKRSSDSKKCEKSVLGETLPLNAAETNESEIPSTEITRGDSIEEDSPQNLALYTFYVPSQEQTEDVLTSSNNGCRDFNIPQAPVEGQVLFLSPSTNCNPVPEMILLPPCNGYPAQPVIYPQQGIVGSEPEALDYQGAYTGSQSVVGQVLTEHKTEANKSSLYLQLKEKLNKLSDYLPQCEHLTPKQYDLINTKLDAILEMFSIANEKAKTRKQNPRGKKSMRSRGYE